MIQFTSYQTAPDFDILFADNVNTEIFYETGNFPGRTFDFRHDIQLPFEDFVENAKSFGEFDPDQNITICYKNGRGYSVREMEPREVGRKIKGLQERLLAFAIWDNAEDTRFWVNGFEGLQMLQQYTGWFDMDIYTDWIGSVGYPDGLQLEFPFDYDTIIDLRERDEDPYTLEQAMADIEKAYEDMRTYVRQKHNLMHPRTGYKDSLTSDIWPFNTIIEVYTTNIYRNEEPQLALTIEGEDLRDATATIERTIKKAQRFGYEVDVYQDGNLILTA